MVTDIHTLYYFAFCYNLPVHHVLAGVQCSLFQPGTSIRMIRMKTCFSAVVLVVLVVDVVRRRSVCKMRYTMNLFLICF